MAGSRKYRRDKNGRFAGSGGGTVTTTGRAGGFASASHRANVAAQKARLASRRRGLSAAQKRLVLGVAGAGIAKLAIDAVGKSQYKSYKKGERASTLANQAFVRNNAQKSILAEMSFKSREGARRMKR